VIASTGWAYSAASFVVTVPLFYRLDERTSSGPHDPLEDSGTPTHSLFQTLVEALGTGMLILALLDACRLAHGIELRVGANSYLS
jgi:hypothetical protein